MNQTVTLARNAMATRFELILHGADPVHLRAAGEEALNEIQRLEGELGFYQTGSEIHALNQRAGTEAVRVSPLLFQLLESARQICAETGGAFDPTVGPLMKLWSAAGAAGRLPDPDELEAARRVLGFRHVVLDHFNLTVRFDTPGVRLDLGSIGKGFAIDIAAEWLREAGVQSALLHGGTSTVYALGAPPDATAWKIAIVKPEVGVNLVRSAHPLSAGDLLGTVALRDASLSVSAVWGKSFQIAGRSHGHVMDPRLGAPVDAALLAAVVLPSAMKTDALSTALLTLAETGHEVLAARYPTIRTLVALPEESPAGYRVRSRGIDAASNP